MGTRPPTLRDLDFGSVRSATDLQVQMDILNRIAHIQMDKMIEKAPPQVRDLEDKGIPPVMVLSAAGMALAGAALYVLVAHGAEMLAVFVSVLQPLYYTFKALETQEKDDDTIWLTYWFVHGVLHVAENTLLLPIIKVLPALYFIGKMVLQVWMVNFEGHTGTFTSSFCHRLHHSDNITISCS
mmetsp:Transcript_3473/g.4677  ORF Transcript_3473/g.4677 Transcript_3473/m.4677 type:complete len:183 (+) Transcript_3473:188-736(+)